MMMGTGTSCSSLRPVDGSLPLRLIVLMECPGKQVERVDTTEFLEVCYIYVTYEGTRFKGWAGNHLVSLISCQD